MSETKKEDQDTPRFKEGTVREYTGNESNLLDDQMRSMSNIQNFSLGEIKTPDNKRMFNNPPFFELSRQKSNKIRKASKNFKPKILQEKDKLIKKVKELEKENQELIEQNESLSAMLEQYLEKVKKLEDELYDGGVMKNLKKTSIHEKQDSMRKQSYKKPSDYMQTSKKFESFRDSGFIRDKRDRENSIHSESDRLTAKEILVSRLNNSFGIPSQTPAPAELTKELENEVICIKKTFNDYNTLRKETSQGPTSILVQIINDQSQAIEELQTLVETYKKNNDRLTRHFEEINDQFHILTNRVKAKATYDIMGVDDNEDEDSNALLDSILSEDGKNEVPPHLNMQSRLQRNNTEEPGNMLLRGNLIKSKVSDFKNMTPQEKRRRNTFIDSSIRKKTENLTKRFEDSTNKDWINKDIFRKESNFFSENKAMNMSKSRKFEYNDPSDVMVHNTTMLDDMSLLDVIKRLEEKFIEVQKRANVKISCLSSMVNQLYRTILEFNTSLTEGKTVFGVLELNKLLEERENNDIVESMNRKIDRFNDLLKNIEHVVIKGTYIRNYKCLQGFFKYANAKNDDTFADLIKQNIKKSMNKIDMVLSNNTSEILNIGSSFDMLYEKMELYLEKKVSRPTFGHRRAKSYNEMAKLQKDNFDLIKHMTNNIKDYFENNYRKLQKDESQSKLLNMSDVSNRSTSFVDSLFTDFKSFITSNMGEYNNELKNALNNIDEITRKVETFKWQKIIAKQMFIHSDITQRLKVFILESLFHCLRENDYKLANPNTKNVIKIFSRKLNTIRETLLKHNYFDLKRCSSQQSLIETRYECVNEIYKSKVDRNKNPSDYIFTAEICFIEMFMETWIPLFDSN